MSRSNPHENSTPNPSVRWYEWNGETGTVRYYDKATKTDVEVPLPFTFLLLDQLGSVGGWHKHSDCRIYSNEVKDTRQDVLVVKTKKDGIIAEGIYRAIKDRIAAVDGQFVANLYVAVKVDGALVIASLRIKASALKAWSDFTSLHRADLYSQAVEIASYVEGVKGRITFRAPVFQLRPVSAETNAKAAALDEQFQVWLKGYASRTKRDQVDQTAPMDDGHEPPPPDDRDYREPVSGLTDADIPF